MYFRGRAIPSAQRLRQGEPIRCIEGRGGERETSNTFGAHRVSASGIPTYMDDADIAESLCSIDFTSMVPLILRTLVTSEDDAELPCVDTA